MWAVAWYLSSLSSFLMWVCSSYCRKVSEVPGDSWFEKSQVDEREFFYFR